MKKILDSGPLWESWPGYRPPSPTPPLDGPGTIPNLYLFFTSRDSEQRLYDYFYYVIDVYTPRAEFSYFAGGINGIFFFFFFAFVRISKFPLWSNRTRHYRFTDCVKDRLFLVYYNTIKWEYSRERKFPVPLLRN